MIKFILISTLLFASTFVFAQRPTNLQGPTAKNYKPWQAKKNKPSTLVVAKERLFLKGPAAKNQKAWNINRKVKPIQFLSKHELQLQGPAAKNRKPWDTSLLKPRTIFIDSVATE